MKVNFDHINLSFQDIDANEERLKRISQLIWKLLDEKFAIDVDDNNNSKFSHNIRKSNGVTLDEIIVPPIRVDSHRSDYEIASHCVIAIHQAILMKLQ